MSELVVRQLDPRTLKPHPLNKWLYGKQRIYDADFVESVREHGVREPLRVTPSRVIVSGHDRCAVAILTERETVPAIVEPVELDDLEVRRDLILFNMRRPKTEEQIAREFKELRSVEKELAKKRKLAGRPSGEINGTPGEASEKAAKQLGMGRQRAERAAEVVDAIDQADAAGDTATANELRDKLENESVSAAHRATPAGEAKAFEAIKKKDPELAKRVVAKELTVDEARKILKETAPANGQKVEMGRDRPPQTDQCGNRIPRHLETAFAARADFKALLTLIDEVKKGAKKLAELPGGEALSFNAFEIDLGNARRWIRFARPHFVCQKCKGTGKQCDCKGLGWIDEGEYERNKARLKLSGEARLEGQPVQSEVT